MADSSEGFERAPVERGALFRGVTLAVHDNACRRRDPGMTEETRPLEFHEIVFPRSGLWIRHCGRRSVVVDGSRAHLFARGDSHRVSHPAGCGDRNTGLVLSEGTLGELDPRSRDLGRFPVSAVPVDDRAYAEHCALVDGLARGRLGALEVEERGLALASRVLTAAWGERRRRLGAAARTPNVRRNHRELAREAQRLLSADLERDLSLAEVSAVLGVSVFHLCRVFRGELGTSMYAHRRSLRVRAAVRLLADPSLSLYEIAARTGFTDRSQLSRAVRSGLGRSPRDYRVELLRGRDREQDPTRIDERRP